MAKRFALAAPSSRVLLAGWLPENLRAMLPNNIEFVPNAQEVRQLLKSQYGAQSRSRFSNILCSEISTATHF
jgi:hypothetical protein